MPLHKKVQMIFLKIVMSKAGIIASVRSAGKYNSNFLDLSERGKKSVFISRRDSRTFSRNSREKRTYL